MILYSILLAFILAIIFYTTSTGHSSYQEMVRAKTTTQRQYVYRSWIRESWLLFGVPAIICLSILVLTDGKLNLALPLPELGNTMTGLSIGVIVALIALIIHSKWYSRTISSTKRKEMLKLVDGSGSSGLIARNKPERRLATWLSLAAGINEELLFRALLPLLFISILGAEWSILAVALSILLFGLAHAYQGASGIFATALVGALFMFLYIATGSLPLVIFIHILFDIRATVALSWVLYGKNRS